MSCVVTVHAPGAFLGQIDLDPKSVLGGIWGMSSTITEEIIARQPPEVQTIIRLLLVSMTELEGERGAEGADRAVGARGQRHDAAEVLVSAEHATAARPAAAAASLALFDARTPRARSFLSPLHGKGLWVGG